MRKWWNKLNTQIKQRGSGKLAEQIKKTRRSNYKTVVKSAYLEALYALKNKHISCAKAIGPYSCDLLVETLKNLVNYFDKNSDLVRKGQGDCQLLTDLKKQLKTNEAVSQIIKTLKKNVRNLEPGVFNDGLVFSVFKTILALPTFQWENLFIGLEKKQIEKTKDEKRVRKNMFIDNNVDEHDCLDQLAQGTHINPACLLNNHKQKNQLNINNSVKHNNNLVSAGQDKDSTTVESSHNSTTVEDDHSSTPNENTISKSVQIRDEMDKKAKNIKIGALAATNNTNNNHAALNSQRVFKVNNAANTNTKKNNHTSDVFDGTRKQFIID